MAKSRPHDQRYGTIRPPLGPTEFDLRQRRDIEYISARASAWPLQIDQANQRRRAARSKGGCEPTGRRGVAVSKRDFRFCVVVAIAAWLPQSASALDPRCPDWPCQQLKVPGIAIASVWSGPAISDADKAETIDS